MSPLLSQALLSILRWLLTLGAGYLVSRGAWTSEEASTYVSAAAMALLSLGWSLWNNRAAAIKWMTALAMARGSTPADLHENLKVGITADPNTPPDLAPRLSTKPPTL